MDTGTFTASLARLALYNQEPCGISREMTGTMGAIGAFSFFPSKNLGCYGDGGMITTNDDEVADQIRLLRNHGSSQQYHHDVIGYNSRLDELQAVILRIKLKHIDDYNQRRLEVANESRDSSDLGVEQNLGSALGEALDLVLQHLGGGTHVGIEILDVRVGQASTESIALLDQRHREALNRQVGRRLNARDAAADHEGRAGHGHGAFLKRLEMSRPRHAHSEQRPRLVLGP